MPIFTTGSMPFVINTGIRLKQTATLGGNFKQLIILTNMIKRVLIYSKEYMNMNTSNITNYKPKDFAELLGVSVGNFLTTIL